MSVERDPAEPGPDDFDRQLRDLVSGSGGAAKYTELSAAERARRATRPAPPGRPGWRQAMRARKLRMPVPPAGKTGRRGRRPQPAGQRPRARTVRQQRLRSAAKMAGILLAFCLLLLVLHLLGYGPQ